MSYPKLTLFIVILAIQLLTNWNYEVVFKNKMGRLIGIKRSYWDMETTTNPEFWAIVVIPNQPANRELSDEDDRHCTVNSCGRSRELM